MKRVVTNVTMAMWLSMWTMLPATGCDTGGSADQAAPEPVAVEEPAAEESEPVKTVSKPADVGVGEKGHYGEGFVATPANAYFRAKESLVFGEAQKALNLYKAENGRGPKTHDEYMQRIIEANRLTLPELPAGSTYRYDPKTEQLMVDAPAK